MPTAPLLSAPLVFLPSPSFSQPPPRFPLPFFVSIRSALRSPQPTDTYSLLPLSFLSSPPIRSRFLSLSLSSPLFQLGSPASFSLPVRHGFSGKNVYDRARCPCGLALTHRRFSDPRDSVSAPGEGREGGKNRPAAGSTHARGDDDIVGRRPSIEKEREGAKHRGERCWGDEEWKNEWSGGVERRWMRGRAVVLSVRTSLSVCLLLLRLIMLSRGEQAWLDDFHGFFFFRTVARMIYRRGTVQRVHVVCVYGKKRTRGEWKGE